MIEMPNRRISGAKSKSLFAALGLAVAVVFALPAGAQEKKPNIVVIFGDDIGYWYAAPTPTA
jgi:hypothetical protein